MSIWVLDIETTIPANDIRLVGLGCDASRRLYGNATKFYSDFYIDFVDRVQEGDIVCTWFGSRFDLPKIKELAGWDIEAYMTEKGIVHIDGCLLAKMLYPEWSSHKLSDVAKRIYPSREEFHKDPVPKDEAGRKAFYNDSIITDLSDYLEQDLKTTLAVMQSLLLSDAYTHRSAEWAHPLRVEQAVAEIIQRQVDYGVNFDLSEALRIYSVLDSEFCRLESKITDQLPRVPMSESQIKYPPKKQFKKDGTPSAHLEAYVKKAGWGLMLSMATNTWKAVDDEGEVYDLPLTEPMVTTEQLTPAKLGKLKDYLLSKGWKPSMYNQKKDSDGKRVQASPMLCDRVTKEPCPNLAKMGVTWADDLSLYLQIKARKSILHGGTSKQPTGWINKVEIEGGYHTLSSDADTCGTPTARFKHRGIVNVPRPSSFMGKEFRGLFIPRKGKRFVGWDASSLEARMEAHFVYPYDPDYAETLVSGDSSKGTDVHTRNWKRLALPSRDVAKTFKYAITYGSKPRGLALNLGISLAEAEEWYESFWEENDGLAGVVEDLNTEWNSLNKKFLMGLDGRLLTTRSQHSLLNTKLQGGGSILMKHAMIIADKRITDKFGKEVAHGLIRMHDEEQWEVDTEFAEEVGKIGVKSIVDAGRYFKLNVPMDAEYKVGDSWASTH